MADVTERHETDGMNLVHIAQRLYNTPLLIHPDKAQIIAAVLADRTKVEIAAPAPDASAFLGKGRGETYYREIDGNAIIPIKGTLVNRGAWVGTYSGMMSYEGIEARLREAAADKDVARIILDIDSPGGEAGGMLTLAEEVRKIATSKPVIAVVNDMAASAAYGLASQANRVLVSRTAMTGSIGVVLVHMDYSGQLQQRGMAATLIYAGEHKVDGHPFGPLPETVKADLKAEVNKLWEMFIAQVAAGRPALGADKIRATQARVFRGEDGIAAGLADQVGTVMDVLQGRAGQLPTVIRGATVRKGPAMTTSTTAPAAELPGIPQATHDAAVAKARDDAMKEGETKGKAEGVKTERDRLKAILGLDAAKTRPKLALHYATSTGMTVDEAKASLEAAAEETKQGGPVPPKDRVTGEQQAGLTVEQPTTAGDHKKAWSNVLGKFKKAPAQG